MAQSCNGNAQCEARTGEEQAGGGERAAGWARESLDRSHEGAVIGVRGANAAGAVAGCDAGPRAACSAAAVRPKPHHRARRL